MLLKNSMLSTSEMYWKIGTFEAFEKTSLVQSELWKKIFYPNSCWTSFEAVVWFFSTILKNLFSSKSLAISKSSLVKISLFVLHKMDLVRRLVCKNELLAYSLKSNPKYVSSKSELLTSLFLKNKLTIRTNGCWTSKNILALELLICWEILHSDSVLMIEGT